MTRRRWTTDLRCLTRRQLVAVLEAAQARGRADIVAAARAVLRAKRGGR